MPPCGPVSRTQTGRDESASPDLVAGFGERRRRGGLVRLVGLHRHRDVGHGLVAGVADRDLQLARLGQALLGGEGRLDHIDREGPRGLVGVLAFAASAAGSDEPGERHRAHHKPSPPRAPHRGRPYHGHRGGNAGSRVPADVPARGPREPACTATVPAWHWPGASHTLIQRCAVPVAVAVPVARGRTSWFVASPTERFFPTKNLLEEVGDMMILTGKTIVSAVRPPYPYGGEFVSSFCSR